MTTTNEKEQEIDVSTTGSEAKCYKCQKDPKYLVFTWLNPYECVQHYACREHRNYLIGRWRSQPDDPKQKSQFFTEIGEHKL